VREETVSAPILVVVEGLDGVGKSTFIANQLLPTLPEDTLVLHRGRIPEGRTWSDEYITDPFRALVEHDAVVMDRGWVSEQVYSWAIRNEPSKVNAHEITHFLKVLDEAGVTTGGFLVTAPFEVVQERLAGSEDDYDRRVSGDKDLYLRMESMYRALTGDCEFWAEIQTGD